MTTPTVPTTPALPIVRRFVKGDWHTFDCVEFADGSEPLICQVEVAELPAGLPPSPNGSRARFITIVGDFNGVEMYVLGSLEDDSFELAYSKTDFARKTARETEAEMALIALRIASGAPVDGYDKSAWSECA